MAVINVLDAIKRFIEDEVTSTMKLQKENSVPPEYVTPYVAKVTLPHKNFMPVDFQVPCVLVGLDNGIDDSDENKITIRIMCATYGGDMIQTVNIPDESGYIDLLNLIEKIKNKLIEKSVINGAGTLIRPIQYGIYDTELVYPYWYGYLQFDLSIPLTEIPLLDF